VDFTISKENLLAAIDKCSLAADDKSPTEAFKVMTVDASKKKTVRFAAVGEYCSVDTVAPAEMKTSGTFNVRPKHLRNIASSMPPGKIQLSMKGSRVTVKSLVSSRKASFEHHVIDIHHIEDPGKDAAWITVDSQELVRGLHAIKAASTWINRSDPDGCLLIPTERGLNIFGCNMYLLAQIETSIRVEGPPIIMPATASAVLSLMAPDDANVNIFADEKRVYLENADTLVSAPLFDYKFAQNHGLFLGMLTDTANVTGPALSLPTLAQGVKAVLACSSFAGEQEKDSSYGSYLRLSFGSSAVVALDLASADAKDEFDVIRPGADIDCFVSSNLLGQMLASFGSATEAQVLLAVHDPTVMLVLRTQGITYGLMTKGK
jgi:hypothetical protein